MPEATPVLELPELALVLLVGISGSGKSSFAARHFLPTEVISSDACRALSCDDENEQSLNAEAFELVYTIARKRLEHGRLTVLDATHVQPDSRQGALKLAKEQNVLTVAIVFNLPLELCRERNAGRQDRHFEPHVLPPQQRQLQQTLKRLKREGIRQIHVLKSAAEVDAVEIRRVPLWNNKKAETGPFDIIGDVHGCCDELEALLLQLGYEPDGELNYRPPPGRKAFFVGDLIDRGPRNLDALKLAMNMLASGRALMVPGNHEAKFLRYLQGKNVRQNHGLERTVAEVEALPEHQRDAFGLPVRLNWAAEYRGQALVVYGHVPVPEAEFVNHTIDIDTGCVFGGKLTALRYPELERVQVPAAEVYYAPIRPVADPQ